MSRLSKKAKVEWSFFWNEETGRRAYNELCRKCRNKCNPTEFFYDDSISDKFCAEILKIVGQEDEEFY